MSVYQTIVKLLKQSQSDSDLVKQVRELPDNYILVDCNFAKAARLHIVGNKVYIEADGEIKSKLEQLLNKLLNRS